MGCSLSVVPKSSAKGGLGKWVDGEKQPTLVEKWIEFREWVRRNRGKKTRVVPINIEPLKRDLVQRSSNTAVVEGDGMSVKSISSCGSPVSGLRDQTNQTADDCVNQHQATMDAKCYSPVPVPVTAAKKTRPKAAKGTRTVMKPLEDQIRIPGAVLSDEDLDRGNSGFKGGNLGGGRCPMILQQSVETCGPVEEKRPESTQKDKIKAGGLLRRLRPKAAKGKRSVTSVQRQEKVVNQQSDPQLACLDAWMKRKMVQEEEL